jgi:transaldolase
MLTNPLLGLRGLGQSVWIDYIHRDLLAGNALVQLIEQDGVCGMTSNPAIFEHAIAASTSYDGEIRALSAAGHAPLEIYESLSQRDVQQAADQFRAVYDATRGTDGYVSLEVNPHLAQDTAGTIAEGKRLWRALDRPNVFIKVPATAAGLGAIRELISEGINVNVTLLFGLQRYRAVIDAYLEGLEARLRRGLPLSMVACVASFFVSRIDTLVDPMLDALIAGGDPRSGEARAARGRVAIANAKLAYQMHRHVFAHERFHVLAARGARVQRLLWASTSTKDPLYSDVKYVEALIGVDTINTMPLETIEAYRDHGQPEPRLTLDLHEARSVIESLSALDIDFDAVAARLEAEGIAKFNGPFDKLIASIAAKHAGVSVA